MVLDMICNFKKCRKALTSTAWVTSCSHAFCEDHGEAEFAKKVHDTLVCPACNTQLNDKFDVVQADLNPPESFKSIVLAGMKPDIVMDIAMRAISFWSYQMEEETKYQESIGKHAHQKSKQLEELHKLNLQRVKVETQSNKKKSEKLQEEFNNQKRQAEEYAAMLEEKNRKIQKLQHQLEARRRNSIHINKLEDTDTVVRQNVANIVVNRYKSPASSPNRFNFQPKMAKQTQNNFTSPIYTKSKSFVFNPVTKSKK